MTRIYLENRPQLTGSLSTGVNLTDLFVVDQINPAAAGGYQTAYASMQLIFNTAGQLTALPSAPQAGDTLFVLREGVAYQVATSLVGGGGSSGNATITGGSIDGATIGAHTPGAGTFSALSVTAGASVGGAIQAGTATLSQASISGGATVSGALSVAGGIQGTLAPGYGFTIGNLGTVASMVATDYVGGTHGGADVRIPLSGLSASLNTIYSGTLSITTQPAANQVWQRQTTTGASLGLGAGNVQFTLSLTASAAVLEYQLVNASGGAVIQAWTSFAGAQTAGSHTYSISMPGSLNWYHCQFRANSDSTSVITSTNQFAVGELVAFSGQSLAVCMVSNAASGDTTTIASLLGSIYGGAISPYGVVLAAVNGSDGAGHNSSNPPINWNSGAPPWVVPTSAASYSTAPINSTFAVQFLNRVIAYHGVPCALVGFAVGSTTIAQWQPTYAQPSGNTPNQNYYTTLIEILGEAASNFRCMFWMQGHNDASGNGAVYSYPSGQYGNYQAQFQAAYASIVTGGLVPLFSALQSLFPFNSANFKLVLASIPSYPQINQASVQPVEIVRQCYLAYAAQIGAPYVDAHDIAIYAPGGAYNLHPSQAGCITMADHFFRAYLHAIAPSGVNCGDQGPVITAATRLYNSGTIGLTLSQPNGGTTLTSAGTLTSLFEVFPSGDPNLYALSGDTNVTGSVPATYTVTSAAIISGTSIALTISPVPNDTSNGVSLDVWYSRPHDSPTALASGLYDNVTTDGLPTGRLAMAMAPNPSTTAQAVVTAVAPVVQLVVSAINSAYLPGASISVSGTYSNGTLAALAYSFSGGTVSPASAAITPATASSGTFSFSAIAPSATGTYVLNVLAVGTSASGNAPGSFTVLANSILVANIANQTIATSNTTSAAIAVSGDWAQYPPTSLDYSTDFGTTWIASGATIGSGTTSGTFSFTTAAGVPVGEFVILVRDHGSGVVGSSNSFSVSNAGTTSGSATTLPTLSTSSWAPVLHFDAANPAGTMFQGSSTSSAQVVNGSKIGFFQDPYGQQYAQSVSAQQPTYQVNVKNNMPGVRFTGNAYQILNAVNPSALNATLYGGTSGFGILIVITFASQPASGSNVVPVSWGNSGASISQHLSPLFVTGSPGNMIFTYSGTSYQNFNYSGSGTLVVNNLNKWVARNVPGTGDYMHWDNGGTTYSEVGPQSVSAPSGSSYNYAAIGASLDTGATYGGSDLCNFPFDGWIHEIILYTNPITAADSTALINYATSKWGN